jgi:hypothetical protein
MAEGRAFFALPDAMLACGFPVVRRLTPFP